MTKKEFYKKYGKTKLGARYGYWWKKQREIFRKLESYDPWIDYTSDLEFHVDQMKYHRHRIKWLRKDVRIEFERRNKAL